MPPKRKASVKVTVSAEEREEPLPEHLSVVSKHLDDDDLDEAVEEEVKRVDRKLKGPTFAEKLHQAALEEYQREQQRIQEQEDARARAEAVLKQEQDKRKEQGRKLNNDYQTKMKAAQKERQEENAKLGYPLCKTCAECNYRDMVWQSLPGKDLCQECWDRANPRGGIPELIHSKPFVFAFGASNPYH